MADYMWLWTDDGDPIACRSCGQDAPVLKTESLNYPKKTLYLCELCARTIAGNVCSYPSQHPHGEVMQHQCAVGNLLIGRLQFRRRPARQDLEPK